MIALGCDRCEAVHVSTRVTAYGAWLEAVGWVRDPVTGILCPVCRAAVVKGEPCGCGRPGVHSVCGGTDWQCDDCYRDDLRECGCDEDYL